VVEITDRDKALAKTEEVFNEANKYKTIPELTEHLEEVAEKFKGKYHNTGGNIYVAIIACDPNHAIVVDDGEGLVALYYNPNWHSINHYGASQIFYSDKSEVVKTWELCK
jgi:hypothetical protein